MPTFEDIKKANEAIVTTSLEHKDKRGNIVTSEYAAVNQRVKAFRMVYPMGRIESFEKYCHGDIGKRVVCYEACVYDDQGNLLANGDAEEFESSTFINRTSFRENCQTSAVGRALGFAGFGIDTAIASAEETQNAQINQDREIIMEQKEPATEAQKACIQRFLSGSIPQSFAQMVYDTYGVRTDLLDDLSQYSAKRFIDWITGTVQAYYRGADIKSRHNLLKAYNVSNPYDLTTENIIDAGRAIMGLNNAVNNKQ